MRYTTFAMFALLTWSGFGQTPAFEVVSIKPLEKNARPGPPRSDPGIVSFPNANLKLLIMRAYKVPPFLIDGPAWVNDAPAFSFNAKIPEGASPDQVPEMMKSVLTERFALKFHFESKVQSVYVLTAAKGGAKLTPANPETALKAPDGKMIGQVMINGNGHITFRSSTFEEVSRFLAGQLGRPVLDQTGIVGAFDLELIADQSELTALRGLAQSGDNGIQPEGASLFTSIQALGLRLDARKEPVQHFVIDSVLKEPTEN